MKNNKQLRKELCEVFDKLRSGEMTPGDAKEINNAAGKIIGTVKLELEYASLRNEVPSIPFLDGTT